MTFEIVNICGKCEENRRNQRNDNGSFERNGFHCAGF